MYPAKSVVRQRDYDVLEVRVYSEKMNANSLHSAHRADYTLNGRPREPSRAESGWAGPGRAGSGRGRARARASAWACAWAGRGGPRKWAMGFIDVTRTY